MKVIRRSKNPTLQQMLNMASNLEEKFNKPSMTEVDAWCYRRSDPSHMIYRIYVEDISTKNFDSWKEALDYYFSIMEEVVDE